MGFLYNAKGKQWKQHSYSAGNTRVMRKTCSKCSLSKSLKQFKEDKRYVSGVFCWCKKCEKDYASAPKTRERARKRWSTKMCDPAFRKAEKLRSQEKYNPVKQKDALYKKKYGISLRQFSRAKRCALCFGRYKLVPDHSHQTGKYRGPLCYCCNSAISRAESIVGWLNRVRAYLRKG